MTCFRSGTWWRSSFLLKNKLFKTRVQKLIPYLLPKWGQMVWSMKVTLSALNVFFLFFLFGTGKNIYISHDVQTILEFIDEQSQGFVVQKYIENPLLLDRNRKFDIRFDLLLNLYLLWFDTSRIFVWIRKTHKAGLWITFSHEGLTLSGGKMVRYYQE